MCILKALTCPRLIYNRKDLHLPDGENPDTYFRTAKQKLFSIQMIYLVYIDLSDITDVLLGGISGIFLTLPVFVRAVVLIRNPICSSNQRIDFPPTNTGQTFQICLHTRPRIEPCRTNPFCVLERRRRY